MTLSRCFGLCTCWCGSLVYTCGGRRLFSRVFVVVFDAGIFMNFASVLETLIVSRVLHKVSEIWQKIIRDGSFHPIKKRHTSIFEALDGIVLLSGAQCTCFTLGSRDRSCCGGLDTAADRLLACCSVAYRCGDHAVTAGRWES